jgi:tetratricopeptide (TPR) repeat protein
MRSDMREEASAQALIDHGMERASAGDHPGAVAFFERAIEREPQLAVAHTNLSLSLTALGRLREAWAQAEWRFELQRKTRRFVAEAPVPRWRGEPLPSGSLLVLWEQGFGDMLQHLRFLPPARERVAGLACLCPAPLLRLCTASFPWAELLDPAAGQPAWNRYAAYVPLLSLPHALGLDETQLPGAPYLQTKANVEYQRGLGLAWRSSAFDPARDCRLEALAPLRELGIRLVSLQVSASDTEREMLRRWGVEDLGAGFGDFMDTALAMQPLEAVLCVDTSVAHLAGALGKRTLLLLNEPAAVRWMLGRADTPWYPTMRLYRKRQDEAWARIVDAALRDLRAQA